MLMYPELKLEPKPNKTKKAGSICCEKLFGYFQHIRNIFEGGLEEKLHQFMVEYFSKYTMYCSLTLSLLFSTWPHRLVFENK